MKALTSILVGLSLAIVTAVVMKMYALPGGNVLMILCSFGASIICFLLAVLKFVDKQIADGIACIAMSMSYQGILFLVQCYPGGGVQMMLGTAVWIGAFVTYWVLKSKRGQADEIGGQTRQSRFVLILASIVCLGCFALYQVPSLTLHNFIYLNPRCLDEDQQHQRVHAQQYVIGFYASHGDTLAAKQRLEEEIAYHLEDARISYPSREIIEDYEWMGKELGLLPADLPKHPWEE